MSQREIALAVEARRSYDRYLRLCIERPELTSYKNAKSWGVDDAEKLWSSYNSKSTSYVWFVAYMLKVFDDLLRYDVNENWTEALGFQLEFNEKTLGSLWCEHWADIFSGKLGKLVTSLIGKCE